MEDSHPLSLPGPGNIARVRMIDTTAVMAVRAEAFVKPVMPGYELLSLTTVAFLIENEQLQKKAVFDLGVRKDFWNSPPAVLKRLAAAIPGVKVEKDVTEILESSGISLDQIDDIIWSHSHWDHVGSTFLFPKSTNLVYGHETGPFPAYPADADSPLNAEDFKDRTCIPIKFDEDHTIGDFPAYDFYGDGSMYLLDSPGHLPGHLCALVRTTPDSFVLLGGDICHFAGDFRPSSQTPLPDPIPEEAFTQVSSFNGRRQLYPTPCPGSFFTDHHPQRVAAESATTTPFFTLSTHHHSSYRDPALASTSMKKMQTHFDSDERVLVCLAHDPSLFLHLPVLNQEPEKDINNWKALNVKQKCQWAWLTELPLYDANGKPIGPGLREKPIVEGKWLGDKQIELHTYTG